jgi:O-antigen ligase/tetratricopeptide (TPR) repeat protein
MSRQSSISLLKAISYIGIYGGLLMPIVFLPIVIFPFVFSKLIFFQVLIGLTFPAYLALAWMDPAYRPPKSALYTAIIAYFGALLLSVIFSIDPHRSWWGNQERMNGLFTMLHFFAWLTMTIGVMKRWEPWKKLLNYEVFLSVFMAVVAIIQRPFPKLLGFEASERVGGLLDNPIYMGCYQIFNLSFLALLFLKTKSRGARVWYGIVAVIDLIAFFLTQSRGALFGLLATVGIFTVFYAFFTSSKKARYSILGGGACVFGLYALAYLFRATSFIANNPILSRLTNLQATTETRLIAWNIAWKGFLERPLTGWGFDAFYALFNLKYNPKSLEFGYYETWFDRAHNTIMDVISMTGLFGLITYLSIFISLFLLVWHAYKKGWIDLPIAAILIALPSGYFLQNLFVFDHPAAYSMSYLLFAFVIVATRPMFIGEREEGSSTHHDAKIHEAPWIAFSILQVVFLVIVWNFSVRPFLASMMSITANNMLSSGYAPQGIALMKQSLEKSSLYDGEQSFLTSRDVISLIENGVFTKEATWKEMYQFTKEVNTRYIEKHPYDTNQIFIQARLIHSIFPSMTGDESLKEAQEAEKYYLRAIESSPARQQMHFGIARFYSQIGQSDKTYEALKKAADLNPNVGESLWYLGLMSVLDSSNQEKGADLIIQSQKAKAPYQIQTINDLVQLARAGAIKNDAETLNSLFERVPEFSGSVSAYLDIARSYEKVGMIEQRNLILNALLNADPSLETQFAGLKSGSVSTIDESIALASSTVSTVIQSTSTSEGIATTSTSEQGAVLASTTQAE